MTARPENPLTTSSLVIALTGGIASGKSATSERFAQLGVPVYDADVFARDVVAPGQAALGEIAAAFGPQAIAPDGELDRAAVRMRVFGDVAARKRLEAILHPRIRAALLEQVAACAAPYCVLAIPLLVEVLNDYRWVNRILTTDVPVSVQLARLMRRRGIDDAIANGMLAAQAPRTQRLALADDIIDNTAPLQTLSAVVQRLHERYLVLAAENWKK
jgi:dephospho-CoA kinase